MTSWVGKGSFTAEIITILNQDYKEVGSQRNYENKEQFMNEFYKSLHDKFMLDGLKRLAITGVLPVILLAFVIKIVDKCSERSMRKKEKQKEEKAKGAKKEDDIDSKGDTKTEDALDATGNREITLVSNDASEISA